MVNIWLNSRYNAIEQSLWAVSRWNTLLIRQSDCFRVSTINKTKMMNGLEPQYIQNSLQLYQHSSSSLYDGTVNIWTSFNSTATERTISQYTGKWIFIDHYRLQRFQIVSYHMISTYSSESPKKDACLHSHGSRALREQGWLGYDAWRHYSRQATTVGNRW